MEPQNKMTPIGIDPRAYRFFPSEKQQKTQFTKDGTRFYFYGQIEHDDYEKKKLDEFYEYIKANQLVINNTQFWTNQKILLFLQGNGYKTKETYEAMKNHDQFRIDYLGENNSKVQFQEVANLISSGMFYISGRDRFFRPVLVFNAKKIDMKDFEKSLKATILTQEELINKMFLPGQVQSWVIIYDLGGMGVTQIPTGTLKNIIGKLSAHYGGRLYRLWVVNAPMTISFTWKLITPFMDKVTVDKIKISKKNTDKDIFTLCDPSQVEKKYGGTQPDRTVYWPFEIPQGVFDETRLISDEEYQKKLEKNELSRNIIDPRYTEKKQ